MKSLLIALVVCSTVIAGNPDEKPSVMVKVGGTFLSGNINIYDDYGASVRLRDGDQKNFTLGLQAIGPTTDNLSVVFSIDYVKVTNQLDSTPVFFKQKQTLSGVNGYIGLKFYLENK